MTPRQRSVVVLTRQGLSQRQVAARLGMSQARVYEILAALAQRAQRTQARDITRAGWLLTEWQRLRVAA